jgi:hypothetical protein
MSNGIFSLINSLDVALASFLPLLSRVSLWGLLSGAAATALYAFASNQKAISTLKQEIRELRRRLLAAESQSEYAALAGKNLQVSITLLGKVIVPALLSALPVVVIAGWMDTYHAYILPESPKTVALSFVPATIGTVEISPPEIVRIAKGLVTIALPQIHPAIVSFSANGKAIYSGDPFMTPVPVIAKKSWLNWILPSSAGYVHPDSPVEEIHLDLPRRCFFKNLPSWASGWEVPYFFSVLVAALAIKLVLKIH